MSVVSSYLYNQMFNQNGDGNNEFLLRGGLPGSELLNSEIGGGLSGGALDGKVVPIGLSVILRQPKRNTEHVKNVDCEASVVSDNVFDELFESVSPSAKRRRTTPTKRTRDSTKGTRRKIPKK